MAEKNQNIRQRPEERYPEPGIPAEEGWKSMNALLGAAMPPAPPPTPPHFPFFSVIATTVAVGIAGLTIFLVTQKSPDQPSQSADSSFKTETLQSPVEIREPGTTIPAQEPTPAQEPASVREPASIHEPVSAQESVQESVSGKENSPVSTTALSSHATAWQKAISHEEGRIITRSTRHHSSGTRENASGSLVSEVVAPEESTGAGGQAEATQLQILDTERAYLASSLTGMQLSIPKSSPPKKEPEISGTKVPEKQSFSWGLQWMGYSPLEGRKIYAFDLIKEHHGAYILAIPGVWAGTKIGSRQEAVISVLPYFDYYSKNELFFQNNMHDIRPDTMPIPRTYPQARLLKLRSSSITAEYHYRFAGNFLIGGELSYMHHWNALANISQLPPSGFSSATDSLKWLGRGDDFWKYLRPHNVTAGLGLTYRTSSLSLGGSVLKPLFPTANEVYSAKPLNSRIFIRWQLNPPKKKR